MTGAELAKARRWADLGVRIKDIARLLGVGEQEVKDALTSREDERKQRQKHSFVPAWHAWDTSQEATNFIEDYRIKWRDR